MLSRITEATLFEACRFISLRGGFLVDSTGRATVNAPRVELRNDIRVLGELEISND